MSGVEIVFLAGSPSSASRSSYVAGIIEKHAVDAGISARSFTLRDFDPADVFYGKADGPAQAAFVRAVALASAIVLSTPVYKGTYAGGLKAIVDLIPPDALAGKVALGIATTRLSAHAAGVDRGYRDLFAFFRVRVVDTLVVHDDELKITDGRGEIGDAAAERVAKAGRALVGALGEATGGR
jgi:FMN reductase